MLKPALLLAVAVGLVPQETTQELRNDKEFEEQRSLLQEHYRRVIQELEVAPVTLDESTLKARLETIEALRAYCERGEFGRESYDDAERKFIFVDEGGRRCAVAELLHYWGEDDLVAKVARENNNTLVAELKNDSSLNAWLERVGLSYYEAARIQAPAARGGLGRGGSGPRTPRFAAPTPATPTRGGLSTGEARPRPGPAVPRPGSGPPITAGGATTPGGVEDLWTHWWAWWEFNKLEWLVQNRELTFDDQPSDRTSSKSNAKAMRDQALATIKEHLDDEDARVRAAATIAYARLGGEAAVDAIVKNLDDAHRDVRIASILALGATGGRGTHELMRIAFWGSSEPGEEIVNDARPLAHLALGLSAHRAGGNPGAIFLPPTDGAWRPGEATALYQFMAQSETLLERLRDVSGIFDKKGRPKRNMQDALPRGVEALRFDDPAEVQVGLMHALASRDLEVRRSAATTLGKLDSNEALPVLFTAFETEKEHLARGLILIAIGRQGGEEAREFLLHNLRFGPKSARPWNALALGILAEKDADAEAAKGLRAAYAKQKNADTRGAFMLALGISGDPQSHDILRLELATSKSDMMRANASLGLALSKDPKAPESLRKAFDKEPSPLAKSTIAQAMGIVGESTDVTALVTALHEVDDPTLVVQHAAALAFHGSAPAARAVLEELAEKRIAPATKAGLVQALGMILDETPPFQFVALSADSNFASFPDWLDAPLQSTL